MSPRLLRGRVALHTAMTLVSRSAQATDISTLIDLMQEFYAESGYALNRAWAEASFLALLRNKTHGETRLVCVDGRVVGYVVLTFRFSMEFGGLDAWIDDLFVQPAFRRRGVARYALQDLFTECHRRGALAVHVEVGKENAAAKSLYGGFGLKPHDDGREVLTVALNTTA
jgi:ribosomal protein S18 acetylase RimI-like enzyme